MASPGAYPGMYAPPPKRRRSVIGPLILIGIGVLLLLRNFGMPLPIFHNFATFWPLLLVLIGVVRLVEFLLARHSQRPIPVMGGGTIFLLFLIVLVIGAGVSVRSALDGNGNLNLDWLRDNVEVDEDVLHSFEYTYDGEVMQEVSGASSVHVDCERGNVTVNSWDLPQVKVVYHKRVLAGSQHSADDTNQATLPRVQVQGTIVEVQGNTEAAGPKGVVSDMDVYVPAKAEVRLTLRRGDASVTQRVGDLQVSSLGGDVTVDQVTGNVNVSSKRGSLHVSNVTGSVTVDGRLDGLTLDTISGAATVAADIFGDTRLAKLAKGATIHTSRTELQMVRLDGELTMDSGDLQGDGLQGPVTLSTRAKNVNLRNLKGDVRITDDRGDIDVESGAVLGNLDVTTHHGDIHLRLPSRANFQYEAVTRKGSISNEFGGEGQGNNGSARASGVVGKGGVKVSAVSDTGDIELTKTEGSVAAPEAPPAPPAPPAKPEKPSKGGKNVKKASDAEVY